MPLTYTLDEVRDREVNRLNIKGVPNPWWPGSDPGGNDCMAFQTERLGLRTGKETLRELDENRHFISIGAFRAHYGFDEVAPHDIEAGDLACWKFSTAAGNLPEHIGFTYSIDQHAGTITTIEANTSPAPGIGITPRNRGVYKKTRTITAALVLGIRLEYRDPAAATSKQDKAAVRFMAAYLNDDHRLDHNPVDHSEIFRTDAELDGVRGKIYWRRVQTWGRLEHLYGPTYKIDGVPGPRSRAVESTVYVRARAALATR